ncbi:MAG: IMPACT family protein [Deinococcales bacterium]
MGYSTLRVRSEHEDVVMGSRFLATVAPVADVAEALALLASIREAHPDASHHCWAYRIGDEQRFSDDGEPGGTAGRPMLEVFLKRDLDHVAAVVVRYFGGRKLGAGGLVRAYGGAVARAVQVAGERTVVATHRLEVRAPFAHVDTVLRELDAFAGAARGDPAFEAGGVRVAVTVAEGRVAALEARLAEVTRGEARWHDSRQPPRDGGGGET